MLLFLLCNFNDTGKEAIAKSFGYTPTACTDFLQKQETWTWEVPDAFQFIILLRSPEQGRRSLLTGNVN
jgi:hypothetical protein